jgi:hypothetical protein
MAPVRRVIERALSVYGARLGDLARGPYPEKTVPQRMRQLYRLRTESVSASIAVQVVHMSLNSPVARAWRLKHRGWPAGEPAREWRRAYTDLFMTPRDAVEVVRCVPVEATEPRAKLAVRLLMKAKFIRGDGPKAQRYLTRAMRQLRRRFPLALPELTLAPDGRLRRLPSTVEADYYQSGPDFAERRPA